jgi:Fe-S-cluster formation regulator IscX/YfhJ
MATKPRSQSNKPTRSVRKPRAPRVVIQVSGDDILWAEKESSSHCMIADAIKRQLPNARHVAVDLQTIRFTYLTPTLAQMALLDFDDGPARSALCLRGIRRSELRRWSESSSRGAQGSSGQEE